MSAFRRLLGRLVRRAHASRRADLRASAKAVLAAGVHSKEALAAITLDRGAGPLRDHACEMLAQMRGKVAQQTWLTMLDDPEPSWRHRALNGVAANRLAQAVPALIAILRDDPQSGVADHAALVLGKNALRSPEAQDALLAILLDPNATAGLRGSAAEALGAYDPFDAQVTSALIAALDDPEPEVRYYTAFGLACRKAIVALPALERRAGIEDSEFPPYGSVRDEMLDAIASIRHVNPGARRA